MVVSGGENNTTNNRMELKAVIEALKALKSPCEITVYSDSTYVVKGINEWLENWIKKDFKKVKNEDLWKEFVALSEGHKIKCIWVKGHNGHEENERCDKIKIVYSIYFFDFSFTKSILIVIFPNTRLF